MPLIRIEYDDNAIPENDVLLLCNAMRDIVSEETAIKDVFVYANTAKIKIQIAPLEIFIEMSDHKIVDIDILFDQIKTRIIDWKKNQFFNYPVNLTLIPMKWKFETNL